MFNKIMAQMRQNLKVDFPACKIYEESVKKGFLRPCFFLQIKRVSCRQELGKLYKFTVDWEIHYYPSAMSNGSINSLFRDLHKVALKLYDTLAMEGYLGETMCHKIENEILMFSLQHSFYAEKTNEREISGKMINLNLEME